MSSIKARLMQPTGIEWMDIPFTLAGAVWKFIKGEYKNKASAHTKPGTQNGERGMGAGKMTMDQVLSAYQSWYGYQQHFHCHKALREADKYFFSLFGVWIRHKKTKINVYGKGDYKWLKRQSACARTRRIVLPACA